MPCHGRTFALRITEVSRMQEITVNRENKDRLFKFIFGRNENKALTLSLYNAVNGSSYTNPDDITITTVEEVLYLSMKNDISFLIADTINFYEQQSTYNPNMPLRMLIYSGMAYSRYVTETKTYIYSEKQLKLPVPKLVTFYNGTKEMPDETILNLSDSFPDNSGTDIDIRVRMLNINYGMNAKLLEKCRPLYDYSKFVDDVRIFKSQGYSMEKAVHTAIEELGDDSSIQKYLIAHEAEVAKICLTEYDEKKDRELFRESCIEEGMALGIEKGRAAGIVEGRAEGRAEVETRLNSLIAKLIAAGRIEDLEKSTSDSEFREKLYKEFGL